MNTQKLIARVGVFICRVLAFIYDVVTFPVYFVMDQPWEHWKWKKVVWSALENKDDPYSSYVRQVHNPNSFADGVYTMNDLFKSAVSQHGDKPCYGTREVLGEEDIVSESGEVLKKLSLGEYKWMTYSQADSRIEEISKGLLSVGIKSRKPLLLMAETRAEWLLTAQACFRINAPVVTLYANLGAEGLAHGINETEVTHVITSIGLLPKLKKILNRTSTVTHVIYMEASHPPDTEGISEDLHLMSFSELSERGRATTDYHYDPPTPEDLAILMYTSGSTGVPKGVMLSNKNILNTAAGWNDVLGTAVINAKQDKMYVAYLPLAHVFELAVECCWSSLGVPIGFSSPQTLTDFSIAVMKGSAGDLKVLRPTFMSSVPLMLDRIRKTILTLAGEEGTYSRGMFDFAIKYKTFWMDKGFQTRMLDRYILKKYSDFLGGKLHLLTCGGAPLSTDTQNFIRACLSVRIIQGYGMTETASAGTTMDLNDFSTGRVGTPLSTCKVRLIDWDEGGYHVTETPHPRGEIVIGGDNVSPGYYKNNLLTEECFTRHDGIWWIHTGDIGEVFPDGTFKIIDRKKDLIKLQFGEYVALGKVEAELKTCPLVENICVTGSGFHSYLVALVVPNQRQLSILARDLGKPKMTYTEMCLDPDIANAATSQIREHGKKCQLFGAELPAKIKLCSDEWTPESGLLTAAFKLRRNKIQQHYQHAIDEIHEVYSSNVPNRNTKSV